MLLTSAERATRARESVLLHKPIRRTVRLAMRQICEVVRRRGDIEAKFIPPTLLEGEFDESKLVDPVMCEDWRERMVEKCLRSLQEDVLNEHPSPKFQSDGADSSDDEASAESDDIIVQDCVEKAKEDRAARLEFNPWVEYAEFDGILTLYESILDVGELMDRFAAV